MPTAQYINSPILIGNAQQASEQINCNLMYSLKPVKIFFNLRHQRLYVCKESNLNNIFKIINVYICAHSKILLTILPCKLQISV